MPFFRNKESNNIPKAPPVRSEVDQLKDRITLLRADLLQAEQKLFKITSPHPHIWLEPQLLSEGSSELKLGYFQGEYISAHTYKYYQPRVWTRQCAQCGLVESTSKVILKVNDIGLQFEELVWE